MKSSRPWRPLRKKLDPAKQLTVQRKFYEPGSDSPGLAAGGPHWHTVVLTSCQKRASRARSPHRATGHQGPWRCSYRGCEHGCIYCYARPTHSYLNLSLGLDFETRIIAKRNIAAVLRQELGRPRYQPRLVAIGTATDCYQPVERTLRLTRSVIELMHETRHAFTLVTKSSGVERDLDLDLIAPLAAQGLAAVSVTLTTLDAELTRKLEPRAAARQRRLRTLRTLAEHGVPCGVSLAPQIPFLTEDMEQVLEAAWDAGARSAFYHVLRLPWEVSPLFRQWLQSHCPQRAARIMARVQDMRGGKDYDSDFASRMKGVGPWAELIAQRFDKASRRLGFNRQRVDLDTSVFRRPGSAGQGDLF